MPRRIGKGEERRETQYVYNTYMYNTTNHTLTSVREEKEGWRGRSGGKARRRDWGGGGGG